MRTPEVGENLSNIYHYLVSFYEQHKNISKYLFFLTKIYKKDILVIQFNVLHNHERSRYLISFFICDIIFL